MDIPDDMKDTGTGMERKADRIGRRDRRRADDEIPGGRRINRRGNQRRDP